MLMKEWMIRVCTCFPILLSFLSLEPFLLFFIITNFLRLLLILFTNCVYHILSLLIKIVAVTAGIRLILAFANGTKVLYSLWCLSEQIKVELLLNYIPKQI